VKSGKRDNSVASLVQFGQGKHPMASTDCRPDSSTDMKKQILYVLIAAVLLVAAGSGCRTAHGFGEDMENAGEKIQEKTDK